MSHSLKSLISLCKIPNINSFCEMEDLEHKSYFQVISLFKFYLLTGYMIICFLLWTLLWVGSSVLRASGPRFDNDT